MSEPPIYKKLQAENNALRAQIVLLHAEIQTLREINSNHGLRHELAQVTRTRVVLACANAYFVPAVDVLGKSRKLPLPCARQLAMVCFQELLHLPSNQVEEHFGCARNGVDYARKMVTSRMAWPQENKRITKVRQLLGLP